MKQLLLAMLVLAGARGLGEPNQTVSFALIGDGPYASHDSLRYVALIDQINADEDLAWVIHAGDIKEGGQPCSDQVLEGRFQILNRFEDPVVLTPGDNEWTDCHRERAGRFDPLERLAKLRSLFFPVVGRTLGRRQMEVDSQAAIFPEWRTFRENVRWTRGRVHFATIHMVGSQNGTPEFEGRTDKNDAEVVQRTRAATVWLRYVFAEAKEDAAGLFLTTHASMGLEQTSDEDPEVYREFLSVLREETIRFGRPVVLAHGDSHYFRVDKPLRDAETRQRLTNFTRVETFGSSDVHWIEVTADPQSGNVFSFAQRIVEF